MIGKIPKITKQKKISKTTQKKDGVYPRKNSKKNRDRFCLNINAQVARSAASSQPKIQRVGPGALGTFRGAFLLLM